MRTCHLGFAEARANLRNNVVFAAILLGVIATQLFTRISATASREAVQTYGTSVFGYAGTFRVGSENPLEASILAALNEELTQAGRGRAWFIKATAADVTLYVEGKGGDATTAPAINAKAVSGEWHDISPAVQADLAWETLVDRRRRGPALVLERTTALRLGLSSGPQAVTVLVDRPSGGSPTGVPSAPDADPISASPAAPAEAGPATASPDRDDLPGVPVVGYFSESFKALRSDALVGQNVLSALDLGAQPTSVYWRCKPERCIDSVALVRAAAAAAGVPLGQPERIDDLAQFEPLLRQQGRQGERFAAVVLVLGSLAVAIVATALVSVRSPRFATLRTLGASRLSVAGVAMVENVVVASAVGVVALLAAAAASRLSPDLFNQIPQVTLTELSVPWSVYGRTALQTLGVGLLTGLFPAFCAYRAVRTS